MRTFLFVWLGLVIIILTQTKAHVIGPKKYGRAEKRSDGFLHQHRLAHSNTYTKASKYHENKRNFNHYYTNIDGVIYRDLNQRMPHKVNYRSKPSRKERRTLQENKIVRKGEMRMNTPQWVQYDYIQSDQTPTSNSLNVSNLLGIDEETPEYRKTEALFNGVNGSVVKAQLGTTVNISCVVLNRDDHETVSWIRLRDHHLITVGRQTYSSDDRFSVSHDRYSNKWILHLRYVQQRDAGQYACQVSTHPPMVFIKTLSITEASAVIEGGPESIVKAGSVVELRCLLRNHSQRPEYVFWYHNRTMINFDTNRQIKVENTGDGSTLMLKPTSLDDSGNYTCFPSKVRQASIMLHVILDDAPAAMQVACSSPITFSVFQILVAVTFSLFVSL